MDEFVVTEPVRGHVPDPAALLSLAGIERVRAMLDGRLPPAPVQHLTGVRPVQIGHGSSTWAMPASPWFQTQAGFFLFGIAALVADFALGAAIVSTLPPWTFPVTTDLALTYLRPLTTESEKLTCRARLVDGGRSQAMAEAIVADADGRRLVHATTRCFLRTHTVVETSFVPVTPAVHEAPDPHARPVPADLLSLPGFAHRPGLDVLRAIQRGEARAPWQLMSGWQSGSAEDGRIGLTFTASPWFLSSSGTIYGGFLATLADGLTTGAVTTLLDEGDATSSLDLKVHYLRPALADGGALHGEGRVLHAGRSLVVAESEITNDDGKTLVRAVGSFMRRRGRDWTGVRT